MPLLISAIRRPRTLLLAAVLLIAGLTALASGQFGAVNPPTQHFEYVHQEVQADAITKTLNDLDAQGWAVFQVVPAWQIKNDDGETLLAPRAYEVFGRRAIAAK